MGNAVNAIVARSDGKVEVRCGLCGKLLFVVMENSENSVDISKRNAIIVARCTRNSCKSDNKISLSDI